MMIYVYVSCLKGKIVKRMRSYKTTFSVRLMGAAVALLMGSLTTAVGVIIQLDPDRKFLCLKLSLFEFCFLLSPTLRGLALAALIYAHGTSACNEQKESLLPAIQSQLGKAAAYSCLHVNGYAIIILFSINKRRGSLRIYKIRRNYSSVCMNE